MWARKHAAEHNPCLVDRATALNDGIFDAEREAAEGLRRAHVLDLTDLFCDVALCPPLKNGLLVYSDENHISEPFARSIASAVGDRLAPLIPASGT